MAEIEAVTASDSIRDSIFRVGNMIGVDFLNCSYAGIKRPFAYSYDVFARFTNPRHVSVSDALSISITTASITSISALYHSPIKQASIQNII